MPQVGPSVHGDPGSNWTCGRFTVPVSPTCFLFLCWLNWKGRKQLQLFEELSPFFKHKKPSVFVRGAHTSSHCALQYYYNSQTQQYLYWDSEKQSYMPAGDAAAQAAAAAAVASGSTTPAKEPKEKKEKPKSKTAQQVGTAQHSHIHIHARIHTHGLSFNSLSVRTKP